MEAWAILERPEVRFLDLICGTKWGKTLFAAVWICGRSWGGPVGKRRWIAPVYSQTVLGWEHCRALFRDQPTASNAKAWRPGLFYWTTDAKDWHIVFPSGSKLEFRSADHPDNLAGAGLRDAVIDEAPRCKEYAWTVTRTNLTAFRGKCLRIGTPKGRNWAWRCFAQGQDPDNDRHHSRQCPSWENPTIPRQEIEDARQDIPEQMFLQEYGAQFIDDLDIVFPHFRRCLWREDPKLDRFWPMPVEDGHGYCAGLDLAKAKDWTVLSIFDRVTKREVYRDRFHRMPWSSIVERVLRACKEYRPDVLVDSTGVGDPILENLQRLQYGGTRFRGFKFSATTKGQLIENLQVEMEHGRIEIHDDQDVQNEFSAFEYRYNHQTRGVKYAAAEGATDDVVMAIALAAHRLKRVPLRPTSAGILD